MCANPFILDIYSYFVERPFYWAPVLYACKYRYLVLDFQYVVVVAPYLNVTLFMMRTYD